ncbi:hypothetical protein ACQP2Y_13000 [Actinoplanes sp. CA-051413]|uniref:hypothetical protein n=1 Tax=Actinoplanes sp. CA-051413 TaxID=3239899 RepID=UPI003D971C0C
MDAEVFDAERELRELRAENERLRTMLARPETPQVRPHRARRAARWSAATVFLVIGCLLLPVGAVALWARAVVFDTDRYVQTVAPLARNAAVQDAVADRITAEVFAALDIDGLTNRGLDALVKQGAPPEIAALRQPMVNGVRSFAHTQIRNVVRTELFAQAWEQANQAAHAGLVAALKGNEGGAIEVRNGAVSVSLGAFIALIKPRLVAAGVPFADRIPAVNISFPIVRSDEIPRIQRAAGLLDTLAVPLVVFAFLLIAIGVWLAPGHRRMTSVAGFGIAGALLALLGALALGRNYYLTHLPPDTIPTGAAAVVWDTLMQQFTVRLQTIVLVGLVIAIGAWLTGSGRAAHALRTAAGRSMTSARLGGQRLGWRANVVDRWVAAHVTALRAGALVVIIAVYAWWDRPTSSVVVWLTVTLLAVLAVIELLRRGSELPAVEPAPAVLNDLTPPAVPVG